MTKEEIKTMIENNEGFQGFLNGDKASMSFNIDGVVVFIFKEDVGTSYYYKFPWYEGAKYNSASSFMRQAIPILSKMLEDRRLDNLLAPNNVKRATLRNL